MTPEFEKLMAILGEVAPNIDTTSVTPSSNLTADLGLEFSEHHAAGHVH